jgi:hypothetical protein
VELSLQNRLSLSPGFTGSSPQFDRVGWEKSRLARSLFR